MASYCRCGALTEEDDARPCPRCFDALRDPVGVAGPVQPDGSQEVILNEHGKRIYGENMRIFVLPPETTEPRPPGQGE